MQRELTVPYGQCMGKVGHLWIQVRATSFMVKEGRMVKSLSSVRLRGFSPKAFPDTQYLSFKKGGGNHPISCKERSRHVSPQLAVKRRTCLCRTCKAGSTTMYLRLSRTHPCQERALKQRLKALPVKGSCSYVGCSTYRITVIGTEQQHWAQPVP